jgi:hypothetical protein
MTANHGRRPSNCPHGIESDMSPYLVECLRMAAICSMVMSPQRFSCSTLGYQFEFNRLLSPCREPKTKAYKVYLIGLA